MVEVIGVTGVGVLTRAAIAIWEFARRNQAYLVSPVRALPQMEVRSTHKPDLRAGRPSALAREISDTGAHRLPESSSRHKARRCRGTGRLPRLRLRLRRSAAHGGPVPFHWVLGVELSTQLNDSARQDVVYRHGKLHCRDIKVIQGDAAAFVIRRISVYFAHRSRNAYQPSNEFPTCDWRPLRIAHVQHLSYISVLTTA